MVYCRFAMTFTLYVFCLFLNAFPAKSQFYKIKLFRVVLQIKRTLFVYVQSYPQISYPFFLHLKSLCRAESLTVAIGLHLGVMLSVRGTVCNMHRSEAIFLIWTEHLVKK
jgi:hypothetical protein